jgi:hypothetical protein
MGVNAVRQKTPFHLTAAALAAALAAVMLTIPPAAAADPVTLTCANVEAIFARGSGQKIDDPEAKRFREQLKARIALPSTVNQYELGTATGTGTAWSKLIQAISCMAGAGMASAHAGAFMPPKCEDGSASLTGFARRVAQGAYFSSM